MFNLASQKSFEHVGKWIREARTVSSMYNCMYVCVCACVCLCLCFRFYSITNSSVDNMILKLPFLYHLYLDYVQFIDG